MQAPQENTLFLRYVVSILTNKHRLRLLGLLSMQQYSLGDLALLLHMKPSLVLRHVRKLQELGLIEVQFAGTTYRYRLNENSLQTLQKALLPSAGQVAAISELAAGEEEREVLEKFFQGRRLTTIPAGRKNLEIIVRWFAQRFEVGMRYQEDEVNKIIEQHYHDAAFFRKDMVGRGLLRREHGVYWREE
ncbi:MAG: DUF2087 domain-containing protein [Chloroflexota bacterium]|nr:DUF2087 domain-containing protein [Chloroflexota bacterium]